MKHSFKLFFIFTLFISNGVFAHAQELSVNCISLNGDVVQLQANRDSGVYRHAKPIDFPEQFSFNLTQSYSEYLLYAERLIEHLNPLAALDCPISSALYPNKSENRVSTLIKPFELKQENNDKAILLIHGLTDTPFHFHELAAHFFEQGYSVRTLLLPGHGIAPDHISTTTSEKWQQAVAYAVGRMELDFDNVYLGGFSLGGGLLVDYLLTRQYIDSIKGVLLWAPALKAKSELSWVPKYLTYVPLLTWLEKAPDSDFAKYESFSIHAAAEVEEIMVNVNALFEQPHAKLHDIPTFVVASESDKTINTENTLRKMANWHNKKSQSVQSKDALLYYGEAGKAKEILPDSYNLIVPPCDSAMACKRLLNVAHIGLLTAPSNQHYGENSSYRNCNHYLSDDEKFIQCKADEVPAKEVTEANLLGETFKRATYNPYFQHMLEQLSRFLEQTK